MVHFHPITHIMERNQIIYVVFRKRIFIGIVVDGVSDVMKINREEISSAPDFNSVMDVEYLEGIGTINDEMVILIDINRLLNNKEMGLVDKMRKEESD